MFFFWLLLSGDAVFWCSFASGCVAGSSAALAVNPIDVVKTRLQAIKKSEAEVEYKGVVDCFVYDNNCIVINVELYWNINYVPGKYCVMKVL